MNIIPISKRYNMPFKSLAQAGFMHEHPEILGKAGLAEWDAASKGREIPKYVGEDKTLSQGSHDMHHAVSNVHKSPEHRSG